MVKYVILIHSNPQPWGHPTPEYLPHYQDMPREERDRLNSEFEKMLGELHENGELLGGEALGDAASARLYRWTDGETLATDGPYSEAKEVAGGYSILEARSHEEAVAGARRVIEIHRDFWPGWEGSVEVRRIATPQEGPPPRS